MSGWVTLVKSYFWPIASFQLLDSVILATKFYKDPILLKNLEQKPESTLWLLFLFKGLLFAPIRRQWFAQSRVAVSAGHPRGYTDMQTNETEIKTHKALVCFQTVTASFDPETFGHILSICDEKKNASWKALFFSMISVKSGICYMTRSDYFLIFHQA